MSYSCATQTKFPLKFCDIDNEGQCSAMNYAVFITPKFSSLLSFLGVTLIIYRFWITPKKDRKTHDRIMLGMSIMNLLGSLALFMSQWPYAYIERGQPSSSTFCNWQGWAVQQFSASFWYNATLSTVFVLKIRCGWLDDRIARYEPLFHIIALLYPTITSFVALGLHMYGNAGPWCWIHTKYDWARWAFFYGVLWATMLYSTVCMLVIVKVVKQSDDRTTRMRASTVGQSVTPKLGKHTRVVAVQAALYVVSFLCIWVCGTANRLYGAYALTTAVPCARFTLMWLHSLCTPLQGFGSFLVYIYPRIREARREAKLGARERTAQNLTLTCKEAFFGHCLRAYKVIFGVGPILLNDSDAARESGNAAITRSSSVTTIQNRAMSPSLATRPSLLGPTSSNSAVLVPEPIDLSPSSSVAKTEQTSEIA